MLKNLRVWEEEHSVTLDIYKVSRSSPKEECYGLTSQMRRASASIGAKIAEGVCRQGRWRVRTVPSNCDGDRQMNLRSICCSHNGVK